MEGEVNAAYKIVERYAALFPDGHDNPFVHSVTTGPKDGEGESPSELWNRELERTRIAFGLSGHALNSIMLFDRYENPNPRPNVEHSDNFTDHLIMRDHQVLMTMVDIRDVFNYHVVHFVRWPLQPQTIQSLQGLIAFDARHRPDTFEE